MSDEHLRGPEAPSQYDFKNWDGFLRAALRYHAEAHPDGRLVSDRIATLRAFMSDAVVQRLGSLVEPQQRYNTTEGWDRWVAAAADVLRSRDDSIGSPTTAEDWVAGFRTGEYNERRLWKGLDSLAELGDISRVEQRELFWSALSWKAQDRLVQRCPYFNPHHEVWTKGNPEALVAAELKLAQTIEYSEWDDIVLDYESKTRRRSWILAALVVTAIMFTIVAVGAHGHVSLCFASSLYAAFFWMLSLFCAFFLFDSMKSLKTSCMRRQELYESAA